ncbi:MAG: alpha/beta fold hydrolase [Chloroflexi bacterium]|nr:alpha/beta fold hydrolase [Chloroflexota bacterium]
MRLVAGTPSSQAGRYMNRLSAPSSDGPVSHVLDIRGVRTHLQERGSGPPLLMLHGAGGAGPWRPYLDTLARQFRVLLPDHPGFGASDRPDWLESMDDMVYHYLDFLESTKIGRPHLLGMSLGGWIAAELAVAHPEVIDRLILVDPAGLKQPGMELPDLFALTEQERTRLIFFDQSRAEAEVVASPSPDAILQTLKNQGSFARLSWNPYLYNPRLARRLYRAKMPTLIIWGREDRVIPAATADLWLANVPQATLAVIDACGHVPHRERPDELTRLVIDFLASA